MRTKKTTTRNGYHPASDSKNQRVSGQTFLAALVLVGAVFQSVQVFAHDDAIEFARKPAAASAPPALQASVTNLPPLPDGVTALKFSEFFKHPVGPRGLEMTAKLRELEGSKIRILGYMVRQTEASPGKFLITPRPVQLHEHEYGLADDLPPATMRVFTHPEDPAEIRYTPELLLLTGTLNAGREEEADGRVTFVRLHLDRTPRTTDAAHFEEKTETKPLSAAPAEPEALPTGGSTQPTQKKKEP